MKVGRCLSAVGCAVMFLVPSVAVAEATGHRLFEPAARCIACHNQLVAANGEDASIGRAWRPTMMANSARDPYWQAGVRREVIEHPSHASAIEDECSKCHMPMATTAAHAAAHEGVVFAHFAGKNGAADSEATALAHDGVSCSLCHQITAKFLGQRRSLVGGFDIDTHTAFGERKEYGPFEIGPGRARIMRSAAQMVPVQGSHIESSEVCATCHTLYTRALDANGKVIGELPEQVPYQEWQHSEYRSTRSCQACHMPTKLGPLAISSVAGTPRPRLFAHDFVGGNFFVQGAFARFGSELGAQASSTEHQLATLRTREHLRQSAAKVAIERFEFVDRRLRAVVSVTNLTGHKLPTAYPSRRVWIHFTVRTALGTVIFESGALSDNGSIVGNDNDIDASRFEPHYQRIERDAEVAIYESVLGQPDGQVTTGLLLATQYLKDNRLLPAGFDKTTASAEVAVHGDALNDLDFALGKDRVTYDIPIGGAQPPFEVKVELLYQPIGFRWAQNLRQFSAVEPQRFVRYYSALSSSSAEVLASAVAQVTMITARL